MISSLKNSDQSNVFKKSLGLAENSGYEEFTSITFHWYRVLWLQLVFFKVPYFIFFYFLSIYYSRTHLCGTKAKPALSQVLVYPSHIYVNSLGKDKRRKNSTKP